MIRDEFQSGALRAVHRLTIMARMFAYEQRPQTEIAGLLDGIEYLLELLSTPADNSSLFAEYLEGMAEQYASPGIYEEFIELSATPVA